MFIFALPWSMNPLTPKRFSIRENSVKEKLLLLKQQCLSDGIAVY